MINSKEILLKIKNPDDRLLMSNILDKINSSLKNYEPVFTDFLNPSQQMLIKRHIKVSEDFNMELYGGYDDSERKIISFFPSFLLGEERIYPVSVLKIFGNNLSSFNHRDYLGSILNLGIKREKIGDIVTGDKESFVFCKEEISDYIDLYLQKVGNKNIQITIEDIKNIKIPERKFKIINSTVASLRIDSVIKAGLGKSRSTASALIKAGKVNLNFEQNTSISKEVSQDDIISIRGFGRIKVDKVLGETSKGRKKIIIKKYI